ncbi:MAG: hypothetical protein H7319_16380 [Spirosoma sp.]|nr:hypothetical protein [Spirosoma sp.]
MIKQLIEDLAYDKITLGQGMTRAKLIASKTKNSTFKEWIDRELNGYSSPKESPGYREIACQSFIVVNYPFNDRDVVPVSITDGDMKRFYEKHWIGQSIAHIESVITDLGDQISMTIELPASFAGSLAQPFERDIQERGGAVRGVRKKFMKATYGNIIELTKQKLLDTLLELHVQFPNLENEFSMTSENVQKVENIVTNNIWGSNNPINVATGQSVTQKDITSNVIVAGYEKLATLGVEPKEIEEFKEIISANHTDKPLLKEKAMKWVTPVITNVVARGLYDNVPQIMDFVTRIVG